MKISTIKARTNIENSKVKDRIRQIEVLLNELRSKDIPDEIVISINQFLDKINSAPTSELKKLLKKTHIDILKLIENELNLVVKNHYRNYWIAIGLTAFGMPIGIALSATLGNSAFISIGLPIGVAIGVAIGTEKDKLAARQGHQLNI